MDDKPCVEVSGGSKRPNISFNGRQLYPDTYNPEKRLEGLPQQSETLYIIVSPLLFLGTDELLSILPDNSSIVAIESDADIFKTTISYHKASALKDYDYLLLGDDGIKQLCDYISRYRCRRLAAVKLNRGYMINRRFYDDLLSQTEAYLSRFWKNRMTTIHMGRLWCRNIISNLPFLNRASFINEIKTDKPVLCAGAGESLEKSISFIKKNRDKLFLTAADTAVSCLLSNGIKPDLIIVVESQHANLYDFYNCSSLGIPVAADLTSSPELLRKLRGPLYFFLSEFDYSSIFHLLDESRILPPLLPPLGSVGITAVLVSLLITRQRVAFTGLDFSFIPDKYHASGSPTHIISMCSENRKCKQGFYSSAYTTVRTRTTDKSGRFVYTDITMRSYSDSLNQLASGSSRLIDIGRYGLPNSAPNYPEELLQDIIFTPPQDSLPFTYECVYTRKNSIENGIDTASVKLFLENEIQKIKTLISEIVEFQNTRDKDSQLSFNTLQRLKDIDYTWLFFPDNKPLPSSDGSFLKRFLFSASWFSGQLEQSLRRLNPLI